MISDTLPTLQPVTISPYARVATNTQTHTARTTNIAHPQCITTKPTISTSAADAQTATQNPLTTTTIGHTINTSPMTSVASANNPTCDPGRDLDENRDCSHFERRVAVTANAQTNTIAPTSIAITDTE